MIRVQLELDYSINLIFARWSWHNPNLYIDTEQWGGQLELCLLTQDQEGFQMLIDQRYIPKLIKGQDPREKHQTNFKLLPFVLITMEYR